LLFVCEIAARGVLSETTIAIFVRQICESRFACFLVVQFPTNSLLLLVDFQQCF